MQHISDLLYKYATGSLSENEKAELEAWVEARPERSHRCGKSHQRDEDAHFSC